MVNCNVENNALHGQVSRRARDEAGEVQVRRGSVLGNNPCERLLLILEELCVHEVVGTNVTALALHGTRAQHVMVRRRRPELLCVRTRNGAPSSSGDVAGCPRARSSSRTSGEGGKGGVVGKRDCGLQRSPC